MLAIDLSQIYGTRLKNSTRKDGQFQLACIINFWVVADYFRAFNFKGKLLNGAHVVADGLEKSLGLPNDDGSVKYERPTKHVIAAIKRVHELVDAGNLVAIDIFKPFLLRLVLCGRHKFPLKSLCNDYPNFFEGWELLLDEKKRPEKNMVLQPYIPSDWNKQCVKCRIRQVSGTEACKATILDHVSWANVGGTMFGGGMQWLCTKCYRLPSLKEWELVKETRKIEEAGPEELERQETDIRREQAGLKRQQTDLDQQ